jgi:hypothetical protein
MSRTGAGGWLFSLFLQRIISEERLVRRRNAP